MKYLMTLMMIAMLAAPAFAAKGGKNVDEPILGGFEGPVRGAKAETVDKAITLDQDATVLLTGNIVASMAGEKNTYAFKDATGEVNVVITPKQFKEQKITPVTKVQISGKIDKKDREEPRIRVTKLEIIK